MDDYVYGHALEASGENRPLDITGKFQEKSGL